LAEKYEVAVVEWLDAQATAGWRPLEAVEEARLFPVTSIGVVISKTKERVVLGQSMAWGDGESEVGEHIVIPSGWIRSFKRVGFISRWSERA
jgi:hypothetical protein